MRWAVLLLLPSLAVADEAPARVCGARAIAVEASPRELAACVERLRVPSLIAGERDGHLVLTPLGARRCSETARAHGEAGLALESNPDVAAIAAYAALRDVIARGDATRVGPALAACRRLDEALPRDAHGATPATVEVAREAYARLGEALFCGLRAAAGLATEDALARWPGTPCGDGNAGRMVAGVCVERASSATDFATRAVDARLVAALEEALDRASRRIAAEGRLVAIALDGCTFERLERGGRVRHLVHSERRDFAVSDISEHALGVACDLRRAVVERAGARVVLDVGRDLSSLLARALSVAAAGLRAAGLRVVASGLGLFYRRLDEDLARGHLPSGRWTPEARVQLLLGVALRDALVDAGFVVYDPLVNNAHRDHLHFHLPLGEPRRRELADDATAAARREQLLDADLRRAAGAH